MGQNTAALVISIVAVVIGGVGLIGGVIGYVQGTAAVARATHARQRAVVAEEEALKARAAAEATARASEALLRQSREAAPRGPQQPGTALAATPEPTTGATPLPETTAPPASTTGPVAVPLRHPLEVVVTPELLGLKSVPSLPADPVGAGLPQEWQPAEAFTVPLTPEAPAEGSEAAGVGQQGPADEPSPSAPDQTVPEEQVALAATGEPAAEDGVADERGRVAASGQDAPTMDWAEVLRTGAIPLPSVSRGTYAPPSRRPKPTGEGPARFELRAIGRQRFEAVNVGGEPAEDARVEGAGDDPHLVRPLLARPSTVAPAAALAFSVLRVEGRRASVVVSWTREGETLRQDLAVG